jgi:hypothetical protein
VREKKVLAELPETRVKADLETNNLACEKASLLPDGKLEVESGKDLELRLAGAVVCHGADATAVAGPSGAKAVGANDTNIDILTYSRAKGGLFAGASLGSASMDTDDPANKTVYGMDLSATQIVREGAAVVTPAGKPIVRVLTNASPHYR